VTETFEAPNQPDLLEVLLEQKVISAAQATVARADMEMSGLAAQDVLIARRWVDEDRLISIAPWLKGLLTAPAKIESPQQEQKHTNSSPYQENLKKYRRLMATILGEGSH
jgi:hypothetical protein